MIQCWQLLDKSEIPALVKRQRNMEPTDKEYANITAELNLDLEGNMSLPVYMDFVLGKGWTVEGAKPIGTQLESSASLVIGLVSAGLRAATLSADEAAGMLEECVDVVRLLEEQVAK